MTSQEPMHDYLVRVVTELRHIGWGVAGMISLFVIGTFAVGALQRHAIITSQQEIVENQRTIIRNQMHILAELDSLAGLRP